jgi:hypothetical protein
MRIFLALVLLFSSCRPASPPQVAPENLTFRSFRLAGARPAGYGYSVIQRQQVWEQFLEDRVPGGWQGYSDTTRIDFTRQSVVILHAFSGTQCFDQPVVQRVTRAGETIRILLGSLIGVCQLADDWIQVIELPRVQGPVRLDYPLDEIRPSWMEREIRLPLDPTVAGFAAAPDSIPAWVQSDSGAAEVSNIMAVIFGSEATPAQRRSAIEMVDGKLIGGQRSRGVYLVLVEDLGDGSRTEQAAEQLRALPHIVLAMPNYVLKSD